MTKITADQLIIIVNYMESVGVGDPEILSDILNMMQDLNNPQPADIEAWLSSNL